MSYSKKESKEVIFAKLILPILFIIFTSAIAFANPPNTVDKVNLERYQGLWYQMALIPNHFQKKCISHTTAEYTLLEDGHIKVVNSCKEKDGKIKSRTGRARINPDYNSTSKLEVTFVKIFGWIWAFGGDYWVLDINEDYSVVVIGHPEREYGWILARSPDLSREEISRVKSVLDQEGYDSCDFVLEKSEPGEGDKAPRLCDI